LSSLPQLLVSYSNDRLQSLILNRRLAVTVIRFQDLQNFLDEAQDGVIYFSLGTSVHTDNMPEEKFRAFLEAFSELPQKILWKWESDSLPGKPPNVKTGKWLPQQDILGNTADSS
jgi:UDP:flavonoid glycosyltransferase YjiC (YdhE family)